MILLIVEKSSTMRIFMFLSNTASEFDALVSTKELPVHSSETSDSQSESLDRSRSVA